MELQEMVSQKAQQQILHSPLLDLITHENVAMPCPRVLESMQQLDSQPLTCSSQLMIMSSATLGASPGRSGISFRRTHPGSVARSRRQVIIMIMIYDVMMIIHRAMQICPSLYMPVACICVTISACLCIACTSVTSIYMLVIPPHPSDIAAWLPCQI